MKIFPFPCGRVCAAATSENEISLGHNTSTRIFTTRGHVWPVKTLDPDYLAPIQLSKMAEGQMILLVLVFASHFVFTWVNPISCVCACPYACVASENQA